MRGTLWLCLVIALLLVPMAAAHHKDHHRRLIDLDLGDDDRDDEDERDDDRDDKEDDRDDQDREGRPGGPGQGEDGTGVVSTSACIQASGGATRDGNVVSWPAQAGPVEVHRRSGGDWRIVHTAEPEAQLYLDKDLSKGRAYEYRVAPVGQGIGGCPSLQMTAVPDVPLLAGLAVVAVAAVAVTRR